MLLSGKIVAAASGIRIMRRRRRMRDVSQSMAHEPEIFNFYQLRWRVDEDSLMRIPGSGTSHTPLSKLPYPTSPIDPMHSTS
jgi:hypothetical protein